MQTVTTIRDARQVLLTWREAGESIALVPTMGALHKGHMALVEQARKTAKRVVVSIFVNPTQFGANEGLANYPRTLDADQKLLTDAQCDLLYTPTLSEIYPDGFVASINPGPLGHILEGASRPGHFSAVATVVTKLLMQLMPDTAFFGEKDYQQLLVVRRVTHDLDIPAHIIGVPTVRAEDGLALSSRNAYLSDENRKKAAALPRIMKEIATDITTGKDIENVLIRGRQCLTDAGFKVDYLDLADASTLAPVRKAATSPTRLLAAATIGATRLIDNIAVDNRKEPK